MPKLCLVVVLFSALCAHAQTFGGGSPGFSIGPVTEVSGYSEESLGFAGGLALGMGDGVGIGFRFLYAQALSGENLDAIEMVVYMRFFPFSGNVPHGFFLQPEAGAFVFAINNDLELPADMGGFAGGVAVGWRFWLGKHVYAEPYLRGGYPYKLGGGVCAGFTL